MDAGSSESLFREAESSDGPAGEVRRFRGFRDNLGDLPITAQIALNSVISAGDELVRLRRSAPTSETGDEALSADTGQGHTERFGRELAEKLSELASARERFDEVDAELGELRSLLTRSISRSESGSMPSARLDASYELVHRARTEAYTHLRDVEGDIEKIKAQQDELLRQAEDKFSRAKEVFRQEMAAAAQTSAIAEAVTMTTARSGTSAVSNIFAPLDLTNTEDKSVSSHRSKTAPTIYRFICNPLVSAAVSAFQDECVQDLGLANFRAPSGLGHDDALEADFTSRLVSIVGPRLVAVLERVLGLRDVVLETLSPNCGVDLRLTSFFRYQAHTASSLPIEVKRYFGTDDSGVDALFEEENFCDNLPCLEAMCRDVGYHNEANRWYALMQTAYYIQAEKNSNNRGVIFSKDGVILMQRMNDDTVFVSTIMGYTNARPHPVAAITYWIKESIDSPSKTLPSVIPPIPAESTAVAETSTAGARRRRGQPDDPNDNDSGPSGSRRRPEKRPRQSSHELDAPIAYNTRSRKGKEPQRRRYKRDGSDSLTLGTSETVVVKDQDELSAHMETLGAFVDISAARLELLMESRCGNVYFGKWSNGEPVVVKAAPVSNYEILAELSREVRAYELMRDLQGKWIPRVVAHGHCHIDGELVGVLAIEQIEGDNLQPSSKMDSRQALTDLSFEEVAVCYSVLDEIHKRGVTHGDLRGANLLLRPSSDGCTMEPVFIDFGFASFDTEEGFDDKKENDNYKLLAIIGFNLLGKRS